MTRTMQELADFLQCYVFKQPTCNDTIFTSTTKPEPYTSPSGELLQWIAEQSYTYDDINVFVSDAKEHDWKIIVEPHTCNTCRFCNPTLTCSHAYGTCSNDKERTNDYWKNIES